jgi:hypothetical protein
MDGVMAPCFTSNKIGDSAGYCRRKVLGLWAPGVTWSGILAYAGYVTGCGSMVLCQSGRSAFDGRAPR